MNRLPSLFFSVPPSPRTPSVTRMPRTDGGHTIPVGWNCTNSMSMRSAPAHSAAECPSPVYSHEFDVYFHALPMPPVAEGAGHAVAVLDEALDLALHVDVDALVDRVVLERADHLQAGAVAHVGQARVAVPAEVALRDQALLGA